MPEDENTSEKYECAPQTIRVEVGGRAWKHNGPGFARPQTAGKWHVTKTTPEVVNRGGHSARKTAVTPDVYAVLPACQALRTAQIL